MFEYLGTVLVSFDPGFDVLRYLTVKVKKFDLDKNYFSSKKEDTDKKNNN